ncbi:unnamed protein product [Caenorhabditis auriculariae]|uniref:Uncharacterized protein n=1 Tax=Caenorhabditis auriculariae TaxID=2777116 RepID=A0A8S1HKP5_9PELO|nr:unnamed protein product [Caenorhabditis auriculariae]
MMKKSSLANMLGEFVALHKTPDFRLSTSSNLEVNEAVREEKLLHKLSASLEFEVPKIVLRNTSARKKERPTSLIDRFMRRKNTSKNEAVSKGEANSENVNILHSRRSSTVSERLNIAITPGETLNPSIHIVKN